MKKTWDTPKLIALVRSKPEETVLDACKHLHVGTAPIEYFPGCAQGSAAAGTCSPCSAQVTS